MCCWYPKEGNFMLELFVIIVFFLLVSLAFLPYLAVILWVLQICNEMDNAVSKKERFKGYFYIVLLIVGMLIHVWLVYYQWTNRDYLFLQHRTGSLLLEVFFSYRVIDMRCFCNESIHKVIARYAHGIFANSSLLVKK